MALTKIGVDAISGAIDTAQLTDSAVTSAKIANGAIAKEELDVGSSGAGTGAVIPPTGTTAQRPASAAEGMLRYNTTIGSLEQYTSSLGWVAIAAPPVVLSVSPTTELASDNPQSIVITGSNFDTDATGRVFGNDGTSYTPTTSTRNSSSQVVITFSDSDRLSGTNEPYDVKVTNGSGLDSTLSDAFYINDYPTWSTSAGNVADIIEGVAMSTVTLSASDPESVGITYSVTSGSLPTGISLNSSTGAITGTSSAGNSGYSSSGMTHNFTVGASDGSNTTTRAFSILRKWYDGSTSQLAASSAAAIYNISNSIPNGEYYINLPTVGVTQIYCDIANGGWMVAAAITTDGGNWKYEDTTWTGTGVLNASLTGNGTFDNVTDRKYNTWNYFQASQLRLWHSLQSSLYTIMALPSTNTLTWHFNNTSAEISLSYPNGSSRYSNGGTMCANWGINRSCSGTDVGTVAMRLGGMHKEGCYGFLGHGANSAASGGSGVSAAQRNTINGYVRGNTTGNDGGCNSGRRWDAGQIGNAVVWVK